MLKTLLQFLGIFICRKTETVVARIAHGGQPVNVDKATMSNLFEYDVTKTHRADVAYLKKES